MQTIYLFVVQLAADAADGAGGAAPDAGLPGGSGGSGFGSMLFLMAAFLGIFYFLLMRPQRKHQRERQEMLGALKKKDEVVTRGGVIGTVLEVRTDRDEVLIETAKSTRLKIWRGAIDRVLPPVEGDESKG